MRYALALVVLSMFMGGCTTLSEQPNAALVVSATEIGARTAVNLGLRALAKDQATTDRLKADAAAVKLVITTSVLPLFSGDDLSKITSATAQQALTLLNGKISPLIALVLQKAIDGAVRLVNLPENPTEKLTQFQRDVIVAVFTGINEGIDDFAPAAPATVAEKSFGPPIKLSWKIGGTK